MNGVRAVRSWRIFNVVTLAFNLLLLTLNAVSGNILAVVNAAAVAILVAAVYVNTRTIHRIQERDRPRPDYAAIARMERDIYGETFGHEGAPDAPQPKPRRQTQAQMFEDDRRAMRELAAESRAERALEYRAQSGSVRAGERTCPRGHGYFSGGHDDRCYRCEEERHDARCPDTTQPAALDQYIAWLEGYVKRGGKVTHFYDYPFSRAQFRYASAPLTIDSDYEYGARGRSIVVASGVPTERTRPGEAFGGWGHSRLYFMHGYRTNTDYFVPVYSDPEFDAFRHSRDCGEHRSNLRWERPS